MGTNKLWSGLAVSILLGCAAPGQTAPALGEKPTKWEYAELAWEYRRLLPKGQAPVDAITVRWDTADKTIEGNGFEEIAEKFKAPSLKDEGSPAQRKMRLLNRFGSEGWEMVEHQRSNTNLSNPYGTEHWTLKRRVP